MSIINIFAKRLPWYKRTWLYLKSKKKIIAWCFGGFFAAAAAVGGIIWFGKGR